MLTALFNLRTKTGICKAKYRITSNCLHKSRELDLYGPFGTRFEVMGPAPPTPICKYQSEKRLGERRRRRRKRRSRRRERQLHTKYRPTQRKDGQTDSNKQRRRRKQTKKEQRNRQTNRQMGSVTQTNERQHTKCKT